MSYIFGTALAAPTVAGFSSYVRQGNFSGEFFSTTADFATSHRIYFPPGVGTIARQTPNGGNLGKRQYIVGGHTSNLLIDEDFRCLKLGVPTPESAPAVTVGAGAIAQIAYLRFYDEITGERGPLSRGTSVTGSVARAWTALPTTVPGDEVLISGTATFVAGVQTAGALYGIENLRPGDRIANAAATNRWARVRSVSTAGVVTTDDTGFAGVGISIVTKIVSRVSHVELWVSVDGGLPRFVLRTRLGTTAISEATATLALGEAEIESFGAMPYGSINALYNSRQLIMGVVGREDTIFVSLFGFPERWGGLEFTTPYNEPIVGAFVYRKYVVILCPDSSYVLQGVTDDDYVLEPLDADIGGLGPSITAEGVAFVPGRKGLQAFNGAFHRVIPNRRSEWTEKYTANGLAYDTGFMAVNPNDETIQYYPNFPRLTAATATLPAVWVGQYTDVGAMSSGAIQAPEWFDDTHYTATGTTDYTTAAAYLVPSGARAGKFYRGTSLGKVYEENEAGTVAFFGTSVIVPGHQLIGDPGGGLDEGKELHRVQSFVRSESTAWILNIWPGDEYAYPMIEAGGNPVPATTVQGLWSDSVAASYQILTVSGYNHGDAGPKTVHVHPRVGRHGRGFTFEYRFLAPLNVIFIGLWGEVGPGRAPRPVKLLYSGK